MEAVDSAQAACAKKFDPSTIKATVCGPSAAELAAAIGARPSAFKQHHRREENLAVSLH